MCEVWAPGALLASVLKDKRRVNREMCYPCLSAAKQQGLLLTCRFQARYGALVLMGLGL